MSKFKVGDKVRTSIKLAEKHGDMFGIGAEFWEDSKTRKVLAVYDDDPVQTDYKLSGTAFFWPEYALVSAEPREFIIILREGNKTIAELRHGREVVKSAEAKCMPTDTFDFFNEGAPRAFDRLMGREEPKLAPQTAPKFKVGDRVKTEYDVGTIVEIQHDDMPFLVLHDTWNEGHNAKAFAPHLRLTGERSEWFEEKEIILIPNESPAPEPKYYSGKVRATGVRGTALETGKNKSNSFIYDRIGVIYEFINGECERLGMHHTHNFDEIVKVCDCSTWQEVEE